MLLQAKALTRRLGTRVVWCFVVMVDRSFRELPDVLVGFSG